MKKVLMMTALLLLFVGTATAAVNINTATQAELQTLKGITAMQAKAIIDYRSKAGKFRSAEDLKKVEGINARYLDMKQLYKDITLTGPTVLKVQSQAAAK